MQPSYWFLGLHGVSCISRAKRKTVARSRVMARMNCGMSAAEGCSNHSESPVRAATLIRGLAYSAD